jgi:hypothetical protein
MGLVQGLTHFPKEATELSFLGSERQIQFMDISARTDLVNNWIISLCCFLFDLFATRLLTLTMGRYLIFLEEL